MKVDQSKLAGSKATIERWIELAEAGNPERHEMMGRMLMIAEEFALPKPVFMSCATNDQLPEAVAECRRWLGYLEQATV